MKHIIIFVAIILAVAGFCFGGYRLLPQYKPPQVANPFAEFDSLEAACTYAEFDINVPDSFGNTAKKEFRVLYAEKKIRRLIEVIFLDSTENEIVRFRKAFGKGDISGDASRYTVAEDAEIGSWSVKLKGTEDGFYNAIWAVTVYEAGETNQFAYSVMSQKPLSRAEILALIKTIS